MYPLSPSTLAPARPTQEEAVHPERWQVFLTPGGLNVYGTAKRKLRVTRGEAGWESLTFKIPCAETFTYLNRCITRSLTKEQLGAFRVVLYCSGAIRVPPGHLAPRPSPGPYA